MSPREGLANVPGGGSAGPEVTLTESDGNVILANGILTATIRKANAGITSLKFRGYEMLSTRILQHGWRRAIPAAGPMFLIGENADAGPGGPQPEKRLAG